MKVKKILNLISILLIIGFFSLALWLLHNELKSVHYRQVTNFIKNISTLKITLSIIFAILSYLIMTFYDYLATKYVNKKIPYKDIFIPSFISVSFGQNIGNAILTSSSLRYRFYNVLGFSAVEIAKVILFCSMTFWIGFIFLGGVFFTVNPMVIPLKFNLPFRSVHIIGITCIVLTAVYLIISIFNKSIKIKKIEFSPPHIKISLMQIVVSGLDIIFSGLVLFFLLPENTISVFEFFSIFLIAIIIGILSTVPGGIGVFESIMVVFLSEKIDPSVLFGSILAYRMIYYICPLLIAMILLAIIEIYRKKNIIVKITGVIQKFMPDIIPIFFAILVFVCGVVLLFSGATPSKLDRLTWLEKFVPLSLVEISHFISTLIGVGLLLIARGIQKKLDGAYYFSIILLSFGIIFSLCKAFDYEEASFLFATLLLMIPNKKLFYRKTALTSEPFSINWTIGVSLIIISSLWLGFFSYKAVQYSHDIWWKFDFYHDAPRFLRSIVGIVFILLLFGITRLIKAGKPKITFISDEDLQKIIPIINSNRETYANLALLKDKNLFLNENNTGFIMYSIKNNVWVTMGDPIGEEKTKKQLIKDFMENCDKHNGIPVFYEISKDYIWLYLDMGLSVIKYGEEARIDLDKFSLEGPERKKLRYSLSLHQREGYSFELIKKNNLDLYLPALKEISDKWLESKSTKEKKFSMGFFDESYLKHFDCAIAKKSNEIVAFTNIWTSYEKSELSIDLMRYSNDASNGIMDFLFTNLLIWSKNEGYKYFNLGMAPLSGLEFSTYSTLWNKIGFMVFSNGEDFYNFQGLRNYKDKFLPEWRSKYIAYASGNLPVILSSIASLISSGFKGVISK